MGSPRQKADGEVVAAVALAVGGGHWAVCLLIYACEAAGSSVQQLLRNKIREPKLVNNGAWDGNFTRTVQGAVTEQEPGPGNVIGNESDRIVSTLTAPIFHAQLPIETFNGALRCPFGTKMPADPLYYKGCQLGS